MGSRGQVKLARLWKILARCAPGYIRAEKEHHWWVTYEGKTFTSLPKGGHGTRKRAEVQLGVVRSMARMFGPEVRAYVDRALRR